MQESTKTVCFVVTAAVLGLAAIGNGVMNQPGESTTSVSVGTPFYPDFTSTEAARSLEVSAVDPETGSLKRFGVESDGDLWRIPTHFDYPAEGAARIAQTSASVLGLERQALVGMGESEFEKFGVVDPLSDELEDPETAGKRITLKDENGDPLVDYIIGNEIEEIAPARDGDDFEKQNGAKDFYIRRADDSQTFRVSLDIDLSTKFSDWIDPDLLRINRPDVTQISINNYQIEERGAGRFGTPELFKEQGDQLTLNRPSPAELWVLAGMDETTESVELTRINEILGVLDEMQIVGVRPKFKFEGKQLLTPDLKLADFPEMKSDPAKASAAIQALQSDLMEKGFNFGGTQDKLELVSENGELEFGTSKGLRYRLHIGEAVAAEDETIEIESKKKEAESESELEKSDDAERDSNRFLYVRVMIDEALLGDRPTAPTMPVTPVKPEGYMPSKVAEKKDGDEAKPDGEAEAEEKSTEERNPQFVMYEEALQAFETAKSEHEMNLTRVKQENEAIDKKIEEGKKLVDELNQRFGDWFYVISASNLKTLQSKREDLVKVAEQKPEIGAPATQPAPNISFPDLPEGATTFDTLKEKSVESTEEKKPEMKEVEGKENVPSEKEESETEKADPAVEKADPAVEKADPAAKKADPAVEKANSETTNSGVAEETTDTKKESNEDAKSGNS